VAQIVFIITHRQVKDALTMRLIHKCTCFAALGLFGLAPAAVADEARSSPLPTPLTRPEMKQYLEAMKQRKPRIPLPELTAEERARGDREANYEGRLRSHYLPEGDSGNVNVGGGRPGGEFANRPMNPRGPAGGSRPSDPNMTLDYKFKVALFWIVSRTNNCQYCLGHQESKLLRAGMTEDEIAALDFDWKQFTPAEQAAFALTRKLTLTPHEITDADIDEVRKHFTDQQILEMVVSVAGNNSINRWKEGVGVPQSEGGGGFGRRSEVATDSPPAQREAHSYLTPTSEKYQTTVSLVAPLFIDEATGAATRKTVERRPPLEPRIAVEKALEATRTRQPRLPLLSEEQAREALQEAAPEGPLPNWMRLVAHFPQTGKQLVTRLQNADERGELSPLLKAQVAWIVARQDRAWYAAGLAQQRLRALGQTDEQIYALDGSWDSFSPTDRALFTVARKLAATPVVLTDDDVALAVKLAGPRDVVQLVSYTTGRAALNRITLAAGLPLEK
jgi:alkylhydroperoxidase family enzyme